MEHRLTAALLLGLILAGLLPSACRASESHRHHLHAHLRVHALSTPADDMSSALVETTQEPPASEALSLPIFVLTQANATTRRANMLQRLQEAAVTFAFVNGITAYQQIREDQGPRQLTGSWAIPNPWEQDASIVEAEWALNMTIPWVCHTTSLPHLACSLSHVLTALAAYQAGHEMVLVLEDDMQVLRWPSQGTLRSAPPGWEVLQLYMLGKWADTLYAQPPSLWVPWHPGIFNTGAYVINRAGMRKMINTYLPEFEEGMGGMLTELDLTSIIDSECVADFMVYNPTQAYVTTDFYFVEEALDSGIKPEHLGLHQNTKRLVLQLLEERGFQEDQPVSSLSVP